ncbi:MAG: hypothetical protein RLZZ628_3577 [Bacteroidota bacterium]|jgi:hypothetical protein
MSLELKKAQKVLMPFVPFWVLIFFLCGTLEFGLNGIFLD